MLIRLALVLWFGLAAAAQEKSPVAEWIASHAIPLSTVEAGHGFADLQPLKKTIGDARIVSLGEATHGSREFFQLKHRMLEFLASEMGFTIFSIEANMPEAYKLNDYVLRGEGDPAKLLKGMYFWTWDTEEVLDMIRWMRAFNQAGKGRLEFTGFDMQNITVAAPNVQEFVARYDAAFAETVNAARDHAQKARTALPPQNFGTATGTFPLSVAAGKKLRFSGYIKTDRVEGAAGLWWRVDGPGGVLAFNNMHQLGIQGTTDWKEYSFELPVAADVRNINFGMLLAGSGTAWFDDLKVELDGQPYEDASRFDFSFESPAVKGFSSGVGVYSILLDREVFHGGRQSLRIRRTPGPAFAADAVDPKIAAGAWSDVIAHLESSREAYREKGASEKDIDWAVQNARVVLECMQMRANEVTRDRSMAENVKWIADHSPKAKMVVWAHNGHVQTSGLSYETMGSALRTMFPGQMVVMGFAFNEGSFQARSQSTGQLKDFTVPPAPAGSLDAMLASTGIPRMALDLRQAPAEGAVSDWFRAPHQTRSIGAVYPEGSPFAFMADFAAPKAFDVILFVNQTTAARANPGWR